LTSSRVWRSFIVRRATDRELWHFPLFFSPCLFCNENLSFVCSRDVTTLIQSIFVHNPDYHFIVSYLVLFLLLSKVQMLKVTALWTCSVARYSTNRNSTISGNGGFVFILRQLNLPFVWHGKVDDEASFFCFFYIIINACALPRFIFLRIYGVEVWMLIRSAGTLKQKIGRSLLLKDLKKVFWKLVFWYLRALGSCPSLFHDFILCLPRGKISPVCDMSMQTRVCQVTYDLLYVSTKNFFYCKSNTRALSSWPISCSWLDKSCY
jgi:hypothetical protein